MSLLLLDADCYVLKSYSLPFYQRTPGQTEGARLSMKDIGTSSISLTHRHKVPFLLFGPEMWIRECQMGDACSVPIMVDGKLGYILTLVAVEQNALPYTALVSLMLSMRMSMERHLDMIQTLKARQAILDAAPIAVYHILPNGEIAYTNKMGRSRLALIHTDNDSLPNLNDAVLNYHHTPIYQGFKGIPCYNKEITWITEKRTYEDITTVVPLEGQSGGDISGVVDSQRPFVVAAAGTDVKAYGTEFNVHARAGNHVRTTLVEGVVTVSIDGDTCHTRLVPGQTADVDLHDGSITLREEPVELYVGWKQGKYYFEATPLSELFAELSLWYDIEVIFTDESLQDEYFSGCLSRDLSLDKLLRILQETTYLTSHRSGRQLFVKRGEEE